MKFLELKLKHDLYRNETICRTKVRLMIDSYKSSKRCSRIHARSFSILHALLQACTLYPATTVLKFEGFQVLQILLTVLHGLPMSLIMRIAMRIEGLAKSMVIWY
jgi:hypothetical protein